VQLFTKSCEKERKKVQLSTKSCEREKAAKRKNGNER
jgi:hypothetical protein